MFDRLTIIGGVPKPIGGVTSFVYRLVLRWPDTVLRVIDLYPEEDKVEIPAEHCVVEGGALAKLFRMFLFDVRGPVYFNFSGARGLVLIGMLPKIGTARWGVTLHNGDLAAAAPKGVLSRILMRRGILKCDLIGLLSEKQRGFFEGFGVPESKLKKISSFVPRDWSTVPDVSSSELPEFSEWMKEGRRIFVISGYPTKIYQHAEVLNVFEKLWNEGERNLRLVAFFYGQDTDGLLEGLLARFHDAPFAAVYWGKGEDVFLSALKASSAYVRMNTVDSYGVAVAEAVALGVPVLASNVCERFPGAELLAPDDFLGLASFVRACSHDRISRSRYVSGGGGGLSSLLDALVGV